MSESAGALGARILERTYVIAEIGVNHGGDADMAIRMVDAAKAAGADAVKFQTFTADALVTRDTPKVRYQIATTVAGESHFEMIRKLEFSRENHVRVHAYCRALGIDFLSTPYDPESARFLIEDLGLRIIKVASADVVDTLLNRYLASTGCGVILSTGMATLGEIEDALAIYDAAGASDLCLLHCVSNYPCADESLNLRALGTLHAAFGYPVGLSDHTIDSVAATAAVALGARIVEKHFTLDRALPGPDHKASATPDELRNLVTAIRRCERMLGQPRKRMQEEERQMAEVSRKSIVAARDLAAGAVLRAEDLLLKRPGTGLRGRFLDALVGRRTTRSIARDELLRFTDVEAP